VPPTRGDSATSFAAPSPWWLHPFFFVGLALASNLLLLINWKYALAAAAGVPLAVFLLLRPRLGLYLTILTLPFEVAGNIFTIIPSINLSFTKIFGGLALAGWAAQVVLGRYRLRMPAPSGWLALFIVACAMSLAGHEELGNGAKALVRLGTTFAFYLLVVNLVDTVAEFRKLLAGLVAVSALTFGLAIAQRYIPSFSFEMRSNWDDPTQQQFGVERHTLDAGSEEVVERSSGTSVHSIINAVNTAIIFPCLVAFFHYRRSLWWRVLILIGLAATLGAAAASFSRTGFATYLVLIPLLFAWGLLQITPVRLIGVLLMGLCAVPFVPSQFWERVLSASSYTLTKSESLRIRLDLWSAGGQIVKDHFFTGMGVGNTKMLGRYWDDPHNEHYITVHNAYLQMTMEAGVPAIALLLVFFWLIFRTGNRAVAHFRDAGSGDWIWVRACQAGIVALLFSGTMLDFMNQSFKNAWFLMASIVVLHEVSLEHQRRSGAVSASQAGAWDKQSRR
jgi:hypothetical protein